MIRANGNTLVTPFSFRVRRLPARRFARTAVRARYALTKRARPRVLSISTPREKNKNREAALIVVACFAVETPRLLLNSTSGQFPDGLANSSGLVGKNLMTHLTQMAVRGV